MYIYTGNVANCMFFCCIDASALLQARFGRGSGPILLDDVGCTGSEGRLLDCTYDSNTADCYHYEDASVRCVPRSKEAKLNVLQQFP